MRSTPKFYWFAQKPGEIVRMSDGTEYRVEVTGWRKIKEKKCSGNRKA